MQRRLAELNDRAARDWGVELACRIGINTGEVVAGDPATGETFVTGDAVNLAKRLEQAAEPGTILIGTETYPLVKDAVGRPARAVHGEGQSESRRRFRLDEVEPRRPATPDGSTRRSSVGSRSSRQIRPLIERRSRKTAAASSSLSGPPGSGSRGSRGSSPRGSRSVADVASGRCLPYGSGITYWPLASSCGPRRPRGRGRYLDRDATTARRARASPDRTRRRRRGRAERRGVLGGAEAPRGDRTGPAAPRVPRGPPLGRADDARSGRVRRCIRRGPIASSATRARAPRDGPGWRATRSRARATLRDETGSSWSPRDRRRRSFATAIASTAEGNPLFAEQLAAMIVESASPGERGRASRLDSRAACCAARQPRAEPSDARSSERRSSARSSGRAPSSTSPRTPTAPRRTGQLMSLVRKGLVQARRARTAGRGHVPVPSLADLRRGVRGHAQGGARGAPRARSRGGSGRRPRRASASTTRSSATTWSRRIAIAPSSSRPTSGRAALAERGGTSCSRPPGAARSDARTCRPPLGCSTALSRSGPTTIALAARC